MARLSHKYTEPIVLAALNFIERNIGSKKVLIHCNRGQSRSPALALLFLAKRRKSICNDSYDVAKEEFIKLCPNYLPGMGVQSYLAQYWGAIE